MMTTGQSTSQTHVAVLTGDGVVKAANDEWLDFARDSGAFRADLGSNLLLTLEVSSDPTALHIARGIRTVLCGHQSSFKARHPARNTNCVRWFQLLVTRLEGQDGCIVVTRSEITQSLHDQQQLRQRQKQVQLLLESTRLAILYMTADGRCTLASQSAMALFGATQLEDLRHPASTGMSPPLQPDGRVSTEKWVELERKAVAQGSQVFEWVLLNQDGQPWFARINLTHIQQENLLHFSIDDISDLKRTQDRVEFLAYHDPLTVLPNRQSALVKLHNWLYNQAASSSNLAAISLKLVGFREFNDAYGQSMGDRLLKQVAKELTSQLPANFLIYRLTGSEYLVLVEISSNAELARACDQVIELAGQKILIEDIAVHLQLHVGVTVAPQNGNDPDKLLSQASTAREQARRSGAQSYKLYEPSMSDELLNFVQTGQALRYALERRELELYYQPQIDLSNGQVVGAEALMRWNRPGHGLVAPGHFIGAAEDSGLIRPMGRWALREACRQASSWHAAGWPGLRVAVNLSAVQFRHSSIRWDVFDALEESGLSPACLELELTESMLLGDDGEIATTLSHWKAAGILLAIDDFGTGYSSLSYLKRLSVDKLKIDRSFVTNFLLDDQDRCIVRAVLQMASSLQIKTVAEGIECPAVAKRLARLGCDEGQGYLYAKPLPAEEFTEWLTQYNRSSHHASRG